MTDETKLSFATFDDIFNHPDAHEKKVHPPNPKGGELYALLHRQRMLVDGAAIHFVAPVRSQKKADFRNSIFKLSQKYKAISDSESIANIKKMFGDVGGEEEPSGDESWEPSYKKMPISMKQGKLKLSDFIDDTKNSEILKNNLLEEMNIIENEAIDMASEGAITTEEIPAEENYTSVQKLYTLTSPTKEKPNHHDSSQNNDAEDEDDDDDEVELTQEDFKGMNTLQKEFMGNNLYDWYQNIEAAYKNGVKLVKVNAMGRKFIRVVRVHALELHVTQPHTKSTAKVDRVVSVLNIEKVCVGGITKEFQALHNLIEQGIEPPEFLPPATLCASVFLRNNRSLSLVFLEEEHRNGFVFFLRVLLKRAKQQIAA